MRIKTLEPVYLALMIPINQLIINADEEKLKTNRRYAKQREIDSLSKLS
jgi:hypothetical protein